MNIKKVLILILILVAAVLFAGFSTGQNKKEENNAITLAPPPFLVRAAEIKSTTAFPENEAGISAYFKVSTGINLTQAKTAFATIDEETSNYIKGTVAVAGMTEDEYPYVWVSSDGWIIAYIPRDYKSEALIAPFGYNHKTTTLAEAIKKVCNTIGASFSYDQVGYYHFKFPDATGMVVVMESAEDGTDEFYIYVNESTTVYNVSWTYQSYYNDVVGAKLDGKVFASGYAYPRKKCGFFSESEFAKGVDHKIEVHYAKVAIVIIYS